ncbi:MAG: hypothetical protein FJ398_19495 [Verrucomicrobia bacterium]|nr:hypothetical protein [Verrucomicrobiota bacterium]
MGMPLSSILSPLDLELYYIDQQPPGLIFSDDDAFFSPRLSLFLDTQFGPHFYTLVQARYDRGFDPGSREDGDFRFDEYFCATRLSRIHGSIFSSANSPRSSGTGSRATTHGTTRS